MVLLLPAGAQEFIGLNEKNIRETIAREIPRLTPDNTVRNETFRYIKYHSGDDNETWLIFLDSGGRCKGVRITCGSAVYEARLKELNEKYHASGLNSWTYRSGGEQISVRLKKEEWFFTITHERAGNR
jgi:hypothetical protein